MKHIGPIAVASLVAITVIAIGTVAAIKHHNDARRPGAASQTAQHRTASKASGSDSPSQAATHGKTSPADKAVAAASAAKPVAQACELLTQGVAQQLLGSGTHSGAPDDALAPQATDTSLSACAYGHGKATVQLIIRVPTSQLGISENDSVFGSGRPANAAVVQGYGQSAYWDPAKHTLNVLGSNNWYIISRSSNAQTDAEAAAKLLKSGF